jgi:hypothetical protein
MSTWAKSHETVTSHWIKKWRRNTSYAALEKTEVGLEKGLATPMEQEENQKSPTPVVGKNPYWKS